MSGGLSSKPGILEGAVKTIGAVPVKAVEWLVPSETIRGCIQRNREDMNLYAGLGLTIGAIASIG